MKLKRADLGHFLDANFNSGETDYVRVKPASLTVELGENVETTENIAGEVDRNVTYEPDPIEVAETYDHDDKVKKAILKNAMLHDYSEDKIKSTYVEVLVDVSGECIQAVKWDCYVIASSYGGDAGSKIDLTYQIATFGSPTEGKFDLETKKFTTGV